MLAILSRVPLYLGLALREVQKLETLTPLFSVVLDLADIGINVIRPELTGRT